MNSFLNGGADGDLVDYRETYNHLIPQRALGHDSPVQALKRWQLKRPDLFVKRVNNQALFALIRDRLTL